MKKILLIDGQTEIRDSAVGILELSNYRVICADDGKTGVEMAMRERPDLIISELFVPGLDGYGILHVLQQYPETSQIPFIFLTAPGDKNDWRKGMKAGADDYLTKPFEGIELLKAVEACLNKKKSRVQKPRQSAAGYPAFSMDVHGSGIQPPSMPDRPVHAFRKKDMLYMEGQRPHYVYFIISGRVKTYKTHTDGKELITNICGPGDFIGYLAVMEGTNFQDTSQVLEDTKMILIPRQEFLDWLGKDPIATRHFIRLMARSVAEKENGLLNLAYNSLRKRVATELLQLMVTYRKKGDGDGAIGISRENLAHVIGSATESLTRTLGDFKEEKLIDIRHGKIYLLNEEKLKKLIN